MERKLMRWVLLALLSATLAHGQLVQEIIANSGGGSATPATYVNSAQCTAGPTALSCTISSLSIPAGDIIVCGVGASDSGPTCADSNSDTPQCTSVVEETTDAQYGIICVLKAGATITTITGSQTFADSINTQAAWYSPGSLAGTLDKSAGAQQENPGGAIWNTGNTATLTSANELQADFWYTENGGGGFTSTYSDGTTQRIHTCAQGCSAISDKGLSSTTAVAGSGTLNSAAYFLAIVATVK
jgi:hypothetical protein